MIIFNEGSAGRAYATIEVRREEPDGWPDRVLFSFVNPTFLSSASRPNLLVRQGQWEALKRFVEGGVPPEPKMTELIDEKLRPLFKDVEAALVDLLEDGWDVDTLLRSVRKALTAIEERG